MENDSNNTRNSDRNRQQINQVNVEKIEHTNQETTVENSLNINYGNYQGIVYDEKLILVPNKFTTSRIRKSVSPMQSYSK